MQRVDMEGLRTFMEGKAIHKQHSGIVGLPVDGLQGIFQFMEPILYSLDALRSIITAGAKVIIEYLTGLPSNINICTHPTARTGRASLCAECAALSPWRHGQELPLPPD
eukprot:4174954-Amphidinium_carterae.1